MGIWPHNELISDVSDKNPDPQKVPLQGQFYKCLLQDKEGVTVL
jgi:hypothetical protein